jgi:hypothetical protein
MHTIGWVAFFAAGVAVVTGLSVSLCAALPKAVLGYAERHGRFQGLLDRDTRVRGTRAGDPPAGRLAGFAPARAAQSFAG